MKCSLAGFVYSMKCFPFAASSKLIEMEEKTIVEGAEKPERKPGGWKSMPYVIGNETFEKLGTLGLVANIMVYLQDEFHMKQVFATNVVNIWSGTTNFAPLFGAFLSDSYLGRFRTLAYASIASLLKLLLNESTANVGPSFAAVWIEDESSKARFARSSSIWLNGVARSLVSTYPDSCRKIKTRILKEVIGCM